jgi:hypothetical protein
VRPENGDDSSGAATLLELMAVYAVSLLLTSEVSRWVQGSRSSDPGFAAYMQDSACHGGGEDVNPSAAEFQG